MPRWTPEDNQPVGPNEHIGRRLFDEPKLFGASDQNPLDGLQLDNFEPTNDNGLSLDRVGVGCFNKQVRKYLTPRADNAGKRGHTTKTFHGWLTLPAKRLMHPMRDVKWDIVASPDRGPPAEDGGNKPWSDDNLLQNQYHAHIPVPCAGEKPSNDERSLFAFRLREVFVKAGDRHLAPAAIAITDVRKPGDGG